MWVVLGLLLQQIASPCASRAAARTDPPALVVQAVDPLWMPLPGAEVRLTPRKGKRPPDAQAGADGNARFWEIPDGDYSIEVKLAGFKTVRVKKVHLNGNGALFSTAYVQVRLQVGGPMVEVWHD